MESKKFKSTIICLISCDYIYHLSNKEGIVFLQQECYYIGESKKGAKGKLGTNYIQLFM
jgi:hypothetical protein